MTDAKKEGKGTQAPKHSVRFSQHKCLFINALLLYTNKFMRHHQIYQIGNCYIHTNLRSGFNLRKLGLNRLSSKCQPLSFSRVVCEILLLFQMPRGRGTKTATFDKNNIISITPRNLRKPASAKRKAPEHVERKKSARLSAKESKTYRNNPTICASKDRKPWEESDGESEADYRTFSYYSNSETDASDEENKFEKESSDGDEVSEDTYADVSDRKDSTKFKPVKGN